MFVWIIAWVRRPARASYWLECVVGHSCYANAVLNCRNEYSYMRLNAYIFILNFNYKHCIAFYRWYISIIKSKMGVLLQSLSLRHHSTQRSPIFRNKTETLISSFLSQEIKGVLKICRVKNTKNYRECI